MYQVVLDTNVLVAALKSNLGARTIDSSHWETPAGVPM
jgi:predicted nucleic acid-binding protein